LSVAAKVKQVEIKTQAFDFKSDAELPAADLVIMAELLKNKTDAEQLSKRALEAYKRGSWVIVAATNHGTRSSFYIPLVEALGGRFAEPFPDFMETRVPALEKVGWPGDVGICLMNTPADLVEAVKSHLDSVFSIKGFGPTQLNRRTNRR